jgi:hypothetical protein
MAVYKMKINRNGQEVLYMPNKDNELAVLNIENKKQPKRT